MSAYLLVEAKVRDESAVPAYNVLAARSIAQYDGRYLVRGASAEAENGEPLPSDQVVGVIEFPSMARLKQWHRSPEYAEAMAVRDRAVDVRLLFVDGNV
ncbi:DUF1330 domain-containing protein [Kibdelosporangium phytohabitans]|uniref:DUF1330 domain-containing protein n=1 Tax=Kibdelosporangium phytohabitans TaxID=860235 RepID=A0A0N9I6R2_9PSEU|nr:DUF1330 domain-containing protein [Kibdelosporangium phytohabitans]ALG13850.1 hypothetical protein AOZ06_49530 [Kibdelosporangium phytohabitans]MBE1467220.1 uncharacterized protein (DUF1330 family) [Kibdelosporangium phytohabitans]